MLAFTWIGVVAGTAQVSPRQFTTLYSFTGLKDGGRPLYGVVAGPDGVLYGTTIDGGKDHLGTVFKLKPPCAPDRDWRLIVIHDFSGGVYGFSPSGVVIGPDGVLYGTTNEGGPYGRGSVFSLQPSEEPDGPWRFMILHSFSGEPDGANPLAGVVIGPRGVLYGTTTFGGASNFGAVFSLSPPPQPAGEWIEQILYSFHGGADNGEPVAGVAIGRNGELYGATPFGGTSGYGTVFSLTEPPASGGEWNETVLYNFTAGRDGGHPDSGVVIAGDGTLVGTTLYGGIGDCYSGSGCGNAFALRRPMSSAGAWIEFPLYSFSGRGDGGNPTSGVVIGSDGTLYGTNGPGISSGAGTVFGLSPPENEGTAWMDTVLHNFSGGRDGGYATCAEAPAGGVMYCTTSEGGTYGNGTVFSVRLCDREDLAEP